MISLVLLSVYDLRPANPTAVRRPISSMVLLLVQFLESPVEQLQVRLLAEEQEERRQAPTGTAVATLINNEPTVISKNVTNTIIKTNSAKATSTTSTGDHLHWSTEQH